MTIDFLLEIISKEMIELDIYALTLRLVSKLNYEKSPASKADNGIETLD